MRVRSLTKAGDDWNALRNHRMEHYGFSVSTEFYQHVPFFWNREGCQMNMLGHYRGSSIFMICNGPSLASGKYDISLLKRPGIVTYGMNNGARTIRPNLWTCVDDPKRFIKSIWFDPCIMKIVPHSFAEKRIFDNEQWGDIKTVVGECPNVIYFHRNEKFVASRWLYEDTINWGNHKDHGGGRSVMLAILRIIFLLGFRNVFLMGADFKMSENYTYHFDEQRAKGAVNGNMDTYQKLMNVYFPELKPQFEAEGFNVYNCNPDSELKTFDYVSYEDAIAFASKELGDVDNERTWGMYSKPEERQKWIAEPDNRNKIHLNSIPGRVKTPVTMYQEINGDNEDNGDMEPVQHISIPTRPSKAPQMPIVSTQNRIIPKQTQSVPINKPKTIPMKQVISGNKPDVKITKQTIESKPMKVGNIKTPDLNNGRIIRSIPCGGGISFGSSATDQQNG